MRNFIALFRAVCVQIALVLSVLLALGPFLHAHFGASKTTGLHVAGVSSVSVSDESPRNVVSFSQDQEQESAALGVETSYSRKLAFDVEDQPESLVVLTIVVMTGLVQLIVAFTLGSDSQEFSRPFFLAGFPLMPHAPPTTDF